MCVTRQYQLVSLLLLAMIVTGCSSPAAPATPAPIGGSDPVRDAYTGPGELLSSVQPPFPTTTPGAGPATHPPQPDSAADRAPSTIWSSATVATFVSPGWTSYASINDVFDLAFSPDGTLWASTSGGLVLWDLQAASYTRYQIEASYLALEPGGALWLATEHGLCLFRGSRCSPFIPLTDPDTQAILAITVTQEGTVWVGTAGGASRFDGQDWKHYPSPVSVNDLAATASGEVWAATSGGIGRYLPFDDTWVTFGQEEGLPGTQAQVVAVGPDDAVWAYLAWEGVVRFDGERWHEVGEPPGGLVGDIAIASDATPWVGTMGSLHYPGGTLSHFDGNAWTEAGRTADTGERDLTSIRALESGHGDQVAAATSLGLAIYQGGQWHLVRDGPLSDRVTAVAVTPDNAAWFGFGDYSVSTPGRGVSRFDGLEWKYYLDDAEVGALAVAPDGALWAGAGCNIHRFDGSTWQTVARCEEDLPPGNVLDLAFTRDGTAWAATGLALAQYDGRSWTVHDKLADSVVPAADGSIWISGWEGQAESSYIARYDPTPTGPIWTTYPVSGSFPGAFFLQAVTPDGQVWGVVPDRGLARFDGGDWSDAKSWDIYPVADGLPLSTALRVSLAPNGTLWVQTQTGVAQLELQPGAGQAEKGALQSVWSEWPLDDDLSGRILGPMAFGTEGEIWFGATRFQPLEASSES